jgi:hypothetical protein
MLTDRNRFVYLKEEVSNCRCSNKTGITKCFEPLFDYFEEKKLWKNPIGISNIRKEMLYIKIRYDSIFSTYVDSQTEILILGTMPGIASLETELCTKEIIFGILYTILNAMPISEMFEEKYRCSKRIKLDFVFLENCETRKFRHSYQKIKRK